MSREEKLGDKAGEEEDVKPRRIFSQVKGLGTVLRAWGEEHPRYGVRGPLHGAGAESGSPARRRLQSPGEK